MRQRKVKNLETKMQAVSDWLVKDPAPGVWQQVFAGGQTPGPIREPGRALYLEIGCGRGDFLLQQALAHPENDYIGIEGQDSVVLRAMEKAARIRAGAAKTTAGAKDAASLTRLDNIRFVCAFVNGLDELFDPGSLAGIYLNFSDPWPKARHAKRRLTYRGRLQDYARALQPGGFIAVKTDNDGLFTFTLEEIAACGWTPEALTWDLHRTGDRDGFRRSNGNDADGTSEVSGIGTTDGTRTVDGIAARDGTRVVDGIGTTDGTRAVSGTGTESAEEDQPLREARQAMTEYEKKFHAAGKLIHYVKVVI